MYSSATKQSVTQVDKSDATWGLVVASTYLEDERFDDAIAALEGLSSLRPKDIVRLDAARMHEWLFRGTGRGPELDNEISAVAATLADPWTRSSWSYLRGAAMVLNARYEEAAKLLRMTLQDLGEFGLAFATPHVRWTLAAAELGKRQFSACDASLRAVERHIGQSRDVFLQMNIHTLRARLSLTQQQPAMAVSLTSDDFDEIPSRAMYGEYLATRALSLAVVGDAREAMNAAYAAEELTRARRCWCSQRCSSRGRVAGERR